MANEKENVWFTVINPNAGRGKGSKDWPRISSLFTKNDIHIFPSFTSRKGEAIDMVIKGVDEGYRHFIVVGGDGTLNEVINGVMMQKRCESKDITIGLIPVGTGNDWGKLFGIPLIYDGAIDVIKRGTTLLHDVGTLSYHSEGVKHERFFINIAGLGYEALVIEKSNRQKEAGKSGHMLYALNLVTSLLSFSNIPTDYEIDGVSYHGKVFSINVGNGRFCGGGMRQTPEAIPNDGLLDITVIQNLKKGEVIKSINSLYDGSILSNPKIDGFRAKNLKVVSETPLYVEADGESFGHTPLEFGIIPSAVNVVIESCKF